MFEHYPLRFMFAFGIAFTAALGFGIAWWRASRRLRQLEDRVFQALAPRNAQEPVADALDSLAQRVDEVASGQEFLNRVLSERLGKRPLGRPLHEATPV